MSIKTANSEISIPQQIYFMEPEIWKDVTNIPNIKPYYKVSSYGNVFSTYSNNIIKPRLTGHGYYIVTLSTYDGPIDILVHRLEMIEFKYINNNELYQVNHIDGNYINNYIDNLEWCTNDYNNAHKLYMNKIRINDYLLGYNVFISDEELEVINICRLLENNMSYGEISNIIKGCYDEQFIKNYVTPIKNKANWNYISDFFNVSVKNNMRSLFTDKQVDDLCHLFMEGKSNKECFKILNLDDSKRNEYMRLIGRIRRRDRYANLTSQYTW